MRMLWSLSIVVIALALAPAATLAQSDDSPAVASTDSVVVDTTQDCNRVGMHIVMDDVNATRLVCRAPGELSGQPAGPDTIETAPAGSTEAPTQFYPLGDE